MGICIVTEHEYRDGAGRFFVIVIIFFFGVNNRTAKTSQCTGTKLGTQMEYPNLTCSVILILLPCHLPPLTGLSNPTGVGKFGDFRPIRCLISETVHGRAIVSNRNSKSYMGFPLVTKSMTLGDFRWPFQAISCHFSLYWIFGESTVSTQIKLDRCRLMIHRQLALSAHIGLSLWSPLD